MTDWKFRRRQGWCTRCSNPFAEGERHVSCLLVAADALAREDVCAACWSRGANGTELVFWFARHRAAKRGLQLDLGTLEQIFVQLESRTEPRVRELRYVLCLLLMRKRRVKLERVTRGAEDGGEAMIVRRPRRKEALVVHVFDLSADRLVELRNDLVRLLEGAEPAARADPEPADDDGPVDTRLAATSASNGGDS